MTQLGPHPMAPQAPSKTSGMAIASLILGILGCCPGFSLLAFLFGLGGIATTGKPNVSGRGMAIAGMILGLLGTVAYGLFAFMMYIPLKMLSDEYEKNMAVIVKDYNEGNDRAIYEQAGGELTSDASYQDFHNLMERARSQWGKAEPLSLVDSLKAGGFNFNQANNRTSMRVPLKFEKVGVRYVELVYDSSGDKVSLQGIKFDGLPTEGSSDDSQL